MARRPLSPHLQIYRFGYTMSLSILHRMTGCVLSVGLLLFAAWLAAAASGEEAYDRLVSLLPAALLKTGLAVLIVAFVYHLGNGIRHLTWDTGIGLERKHARRSGGLVVAFTVLVAGTLIALLFFGGRAS